jgi:hypothetical protein
MKININFDFNIDSNGLDPDSHSPTLKSYHKILWSKALPSGSTFELTDNPPVKYLAYKNSKIQIDLSSDSIANSYMKSKAYPIASLVNEIDANLVSSFRKLNSTIGGYILFPSQRVGGLMNINGSRGFSRLIADRFDLTLECIRLYYQSKTSPLYMVLDRYEKFFRLFKNFEGYVDFFLLNDLVNPDYSVNFFLPRAENFSKVGYPLDKEEYLLYRENSMEFVSNRNKRIGRLFK